MTPSNLRAAAGLGLFCLSIFVLSASSLVLVDSAWANDVKINACTTVATCACATCAATNNVYQCLPGPLGTNVIYGNCSLQPSGACGFGPTNPGCGTVDWDCAETPVTISGSNCLTDVPCVCSTKSKT